MKTIVIAIAAFLALAAAAAAYQFPMVPFTNGDGPMLPGRNGPMIPNTPGEPAPPPGDCSGAADFSDGCAIAVFH